VVSSTRLAYGSVCASKPAPNRAPTPNLYRRVDNLLRELANPNLYDIANMSFRVELWDRHANHVQWVVAAAGTVSVAALDQAIKNWPHERFTLRQGILLIREHAPSGK
jgi:hypothetical protein